MRVIIAIVFGLCASGTVLAEQPTMVDQYIAAAEQFVGTPAGGDPSRYLVEEPRRIMDGLDGIWIPISTLAPYSDDNVPGDAVIKETCKRVPFEIVAKPPFSMTITTWRGEEASVETIYSARGGNLFGTYTDVESYMNFLGVEKAKRGEPSMATTLKHINDLVTIYRPSPDILVVNHFGYMNIYGRCP